MKPSNRIQKKYMQSAHKFLRKGDIDNSLKYFLKGSKKFPRNHEFFIGAGFCFIMKDETDFAIASLKKAIAIQPFYPVGYIVIIECFIKIEEYGEAFVYYNYIDPRSIDNLELKTDFDDFSRFFEEKGFKKTGENIANQTMRMMYDELIPYLIKSGKLSEGYINDLEKYLMKANLGCITDYLMNNKADTNVVPKEDINIFERESPNFSATLEEIILLYDQ